MPDDSEHYAGLTAGDTYKRFRCPACGDVNGANTWIDGEGNEVVVCGACWEVHDAATVPEA